MTSIDVSSNWMHFPHRDSRSRSNSTPNPPTTATASVSLPPVSASPPGKSSTPAKQEDNNVTIVHHHPHLPHPHLPHVHHPTLPQTTSSPSLANGTGQTASSPTTPPPATSRRGSWLSSISSKFSSTSAENQPLSASPPADSGSPKSQPPGFLISTLRKLSSPSTTGGRFGRGGGQYAAKCERMVLNRDAMRERCQINELDGGKLRKVAFCVDVEVAPIDQDMEARRIEKKRRKELKAVEKEKEATKETADGNGNGNGNIGSEGSSEVKGPETSSPKKEKTKEEKRERKEKKKERRANEKMTPLLDDEDPSAGGLLDSPTVDGEGGVKVHAPAAPLPRKVHTKPTTDPVHIYKRCCQLRETQQLPKVNEQLVLSNGATVLQTLDLSGHNFLLPDAIALSDFLALVPVKNLLMESCALTDEMVRVVLCGLTIVKPHLPPGSSLKKHDDAPPEKPRPAFSGRHGKRRGVVERISFKDNSKIGRDGWRYISLFIHMSHTLKAIDLSLIPLPRPPAVHAPSHPGHPGHSKGNKKDRVLPANDTTALFSRALGERLVGAGLEELALGGCGLSAEQLNCVLVGIVKGGTKRLGLGSNKIGVDGMAMLGKWIRGGEEGAGSCEALDLSGNSIQDHVDMISASLTPRSPLIALSLSNCNLSAASLAALLPALTTLPRFRLLDLSNNPLLFSAQPDALPLLRKYLPKLHSLRKLLLSNTDMTPDHGIALSEILPEIPMLAHFDITGNTALLPTAPPPPSLSSEETDLDTLQLNDGGSLEEGAALFTALVAAVKVSKTIVRVDTDDLGANTGDVIKALARRVLAYCLRNMEAGACDDWTIDMDIKPSAPSPSPADDEDDDDDDFAGHEGPWDEEEHYVVGGTGVVKALGVCLGNKPYGVRRASWSSQYNKGVSTGGVLQRVDTGGSVGSYATAEEGDEEGGEKAGEMARSLLSRARRIKERIQPALRKACSGQVEEMQHRRLLFLDETLYRVIRRFEEEYPECRLPLASIPEPEEIPSPRGSLSSTNSASLPSPHLDLQDNPSYAIHSTEIKTISRRSSEVSLASRNLDNEEGQMHRFGHFIRKEVLRPQTPDHLRGKSGEEIDEEHVRRIRRVVEDMGGDEIRRKVKEGGGVEKMMEKIGEVGGVYGRVLGGETGGMTDREVEAVVRLEYFGEGIRVGDTEVKRAPIARKEVPVTRKEVPVTRKEVPTGRKGSEGNRR